MLLRLLARPRFFHSLRKQNCGELVSPFRQIAQICAEDVGRLVECHMLRFTKSAQSINCKIGSLVGMLQPGRSRRLVFSLSGRKLGKAAPGDR
jgi:hypothetical protein